jgi:hypothetical protein
MKLGSNKSKEFSHISSDIYKQQSNDGSDFDIKVKDERKGSQNLSNFLPVSNNSVQSKQQD